MWYADIFALIMVKLVGCTKYGCCVEQRLSWAFISRFYVFFSPCVYAYKTSQVLWCFIYTLIQTSNYKTFSYHQIYSPQSSLLPTTSILIDDFVRIFEMHSKSFYIWKSHSNFVLLCIYKQIGIWINAKRTQFIIL